MNPATHANHPCKENNSVFETRLGMHFVHSVSRRRFLFAPLPAETMGALLPLILEGTRVRNCYGPELMNVGGRRLDNQCPLVHIDPVVSYLPAVILRLD